MMGHALGRMGERKAQLAVFEALGLGWETGDGRRVAGAVVGRPVLFPFLSSHHVQPAPAAAAPTAPATAAAAAAAPAVAPAVPTAGLTAHGHQQVSSPHPFMRGVGRFQPCHSGPCLGNPLPSPYSQGHAPRGGQGMEMRGLKKEGRSDSPSNPLTTTLNTQGAPPAAATAAASESPGHQLSLPPQWLCASESFASAAVARYGYRTFSFRLSGSFPAAPSH